MTDKALNIPGPLLWRVWNEAEKRGISTRDLVAEALDALNRPIPNSGPNLGDTARATRARIVELVKAGMDDGAISVEIDRVRGYVAQVRRANGLAANPRVSEWERLHIIKTLDARKREEVHE